MGRFLKILFYAIGGLIALLLVVGITFSLVFDPNDYREDISTGFRDETGRNLVIEGDLDVSIFPWLAIEAGKTTISNADGFGEEPFATFDSARIGVRLLPLIFGQEIAVGGASIEGLRVNLAVDANGRTNWDDLSDAGDDVPTAAEQVGQDAAADSGRKIRVAKVHVADAALSYVNDQLDERYEIRDMEFLTGAVVRGEPVDVSASLSFLAEPAGTSGRVALETIVEFDDARIRLDEFEIGGNVDGVADVPVTFSFSAPAVELNTVERVADFGTLEFDLLDVRLAADVEPFSYADSPTPRAALRVDAFSPRSLMRTLDVDGPETADPTALGKLMIDAKTVVSDSRISLTDLVLVLDETTFNGELAIPRDSSGKFRLNLAGDSIDLNRYMAPADDSATADAGSGEPPLEIPVDLIKALNAQGRVTLTRADLGGMVFENIEVGLNASNARLRVHPITADFFEGNYQGDIRINAAAAKPVLSVNERINDVSLRALGRSMFERDNLTGTINGVFRLSGDGFNMAEIQRNLDGNLSFTLNDGAWEGVDLWHQLRAARAAFRREPAPEAPANPRTPFSEVSATGTVRDGILSNEDFFAELPFMQLRGQGTVNLPAASVDYSLSGRVFEKPEYLPDDITPEELEDLTKVQLPLRISGPLAAPKVGVDFQAIVKQRVQEEVEDVLRDKLRDLLDRD